MRTCPKCGCRTSFWTADLVSGVCWTCRNSPNGPNANEGGPNANEGGPNEDRFPPFLYLLPILAMLLIPAWKLFQGVQNYRAEQEHPALKYMRDHPPLPPMPPPPLPPERRWP
jgi:hypothetical protein